MRNHTQDMLLLDHYNGKRASLQKAYELKMNKGDTQALLWYSSEEMKLNKWFIKQLRS